MRIESFFRTVLLAHIVFAPDEPGAGGGDPATPPAGDPATPPAGDPATPPAGDPATPPAGGDAKWFEDKRFTDDQKRNLTALGLTVDDPLDAVQKLTDLEIAAKRRLGGSPDDFVKKPGRDEKVSDWMRSNAELFGIPENPDGYELSKPEAWPKDAEWDQDLETEARKIAHEEGISGAALNRMVGLYAGKVGAMLAGADEQLAQANQEMMAELTKDWGGETNARMAQAQQAASVVAAKAGLSQEQIAGISMALKPQVGDAGVIKLFAAIGGMMGDDTMDALNVPGGGMNTTPAEARAQLQELTAEGGEYYKAVEKARKGNRQGFKEIQAKVDRLRKIAAG